MWVSLKHVILLFVVGVGLSVSSELGSGSFDDVGSGNSDDVGSGNFDDVGSGNSDDVGSGNFDDLGSGNVASTEILPNVITNSSKEAIINEYIIVDNEEDGSTVAENEDLYVEVEEQLVDGSGGSGSGDHDDLFQSEMFNLVDVDDVGSGEGQVVHEEANGSGDEDKNDLGSLEVNENIGGDVVNGYRIMGVSSNQVVPNDSVDESLVENDDISLEVNVEAAVTSELPLDVTEAEDTSELPLDVTSEAAVTELPLDVTSEAPKVDTSSPEPVMEDGDDAASEDIEIADSNVDKSNLLEKKESRKEEKKKPEDDLGFLGMIASKRAMSIYPRDNVIEASSDNDHDDDEDHDINEILDYLNSVETITTTTIPYRTIAPTEDIFDYLNAIEAIEAPVVKSPGQMKMKGRFENYKRLENYDRPRQAPVDYSTSATQGHKRGPVISVFISIAVVCFFV